MSTLGGKPPPDSALLEKLGLAVSSREVRSMGVGLGRHVHIHHTMRGRVFGSWSPVDAAKALEREGHVVLDLSVSVRQDVHVSYDWALLPFVEQGMLEVEFELVTLEVRA